MMKLRTKDSDSHIELSFANYPFNSEKSLLSDRFNKSFLFSIYSPFLKNGVEVLALSISTGSNSM